MSMKVRFKLKGAGRNPGDVEDVYDETLAQAWIDGGLVERVGGPDNPKAKPVERAIESPPKHTAIRGPKVRKKGR